MSAPKRVQRSRIAGQKGIPEGAIYVGRPGKWGNPFAAKIGRGGEAGQATMTREYLVEDFRRWLTDPTEIDPRNGRRHFITDTGRLGFQGVAYDGRPTPDSIRAALAGHDLACWCPLDQPCHADVLLEIANGVSS